MNQRNTFRIGVIADTHGLFDPVVRRYFNAVDHIFHAGDIGNRPVIAQLEQLAPVTAVSGNVDSYEQSGFPSKVVVELLSRRIIIRHILYEGGKMTKEGRELLEHEQPDIFIFGHTHQPKAEWFGKTLLFNPGSAGPKRFTLPRGIGLLYIHGAEVEPHLISLPDSARPT